MAEARAKAEAEAKAKAEADKAKADADAKKKAEDEAKRKSEAETKARAEAEAKAKAEQEAKKQAAAQSPYAGFWQVVIDCPIMNVRPFVNTSLGILTNPFSTGFLGGTSSGEFSESGGRLTVAWRGRSGEAWNATFSLRPGGSNVYRGSTMMSGGTGNLSPREFPCTVVMTKLA